MRLKLVVTPFSVRLLPMFALDDSPLLSLLAAGVGSANPVLALFCLSLSVALLTNLPGKQPQTGRSSLRLHWVAGAVTTTHHGEVDDHVWPTFTSSK